MTCWLYKLWTLNSKHTVIQSTPQYTVVAEVGSAVVVTLRKLKRDLKVPLSYNRKVKKAQESFGTKPLPPGSRNSSLPKTQKVIKKRPSLS